MSAMFLCRLFHRDQPQEQLDACLVGADCLTVGRDPGAGWTLDDPDGTLSRVHCTLRVENGRLMLRDRSSNGTFLQDGQRAPKAQAVPVAPGQSFAIGPLVVRVDEAPTARLDGDGSGTILAGTNDGRDFGFPSDWIDAIATPAASAHRDASLMEAFCEGAGLDASAFSGEDPVELMRRLGAIYRQTVIGLATLIGDRSRLKGAHQLERTTIGAVGNNPFKWTASRRLAQNLLCARPAGYLSGVDAVRASFEDVTTHLRAVDAAAAAAVSAVLERLSPQSIQEEADGRGFSLRSKSAACWDVHVERHSALGSPESGEGAAAEAFRAGYTQAATDPAAARG